MPACLLCSPSCNQTNPSAPRLEMEMKRCVLWICQKKLLLQLGTSSICKSGRNSALQKPRVDIANRFTALWVCPAFSSISPFYGFWCSHWTETFVCKFAILPDSEFARSLLLLFLEGAVIRTEGAKRLLAHYSS